MLPEKMQQYAASKYNQSQREIMNIVQNLKPGDLQLIQGPPGTGKTETIAGIISLLLHKNGLDKKIII